MDATALGSLLVGVAGVAGVVVTWVGRRGETALSGYSSLTDDLQEERTELRKERDELRERVSDLSARLAELGALRAADQAELARLRGIITHLGGDPT